MRQGTTRNWTLLSNPPNAGPLSVTVQPSRFLTVNRELRILIPVRNKVNLSGVPDRITFRVVTILATAK